MTTKIAISLPDELASASRQAVVEGRARSVSGYVADLIAKDKRRETLLDVLAEMDRKYGPVPPETVAKVEAQLNGTYEFNQ